MLELFPLLKWGIFALFTYFAYEFFSALFSLIPERISRVRRLTQHKKEGFNWKKVLVPGKRHEDEEFKQLLREAGLNFSVLDYLFKKRLIILLLLFDVYLYFYYLSMKSGYAVTDYTMFYILTFLIIGGSFLDKLFLKMVAKQREEQLVEEIHRLSKKIGLFITGNYGLHETLKRLESDAKLLKQPIEELIKGWYSGAEEAILQFGERIGTKSGQDFALSILTLKQAPTKNTLELLENRSDSFKKKSKLKRATRKESRSIVFYLFTVFPILIVVIWFIYPFFIEAGKTLDNL